MVSVWQDRRWVSGPVPRGFKLVEATRVDCLDREGTRSYRNCWLKNQVTPPLVGIQVGVRPGILNNPPLPFLNLRVGHGGFDKEGVLAIRVEKWARQGTDQVQRVEPADEEIGPPRLVRLSPLKQGRIAGKEQRIVAPLLENRLSRRRSNLRERL